MNRRRTLRGQRGYALAEVLIAAAIAAAVFAAAAAAISSVVRLSARTSDAAAILSEAKIITARLRSGMDARDSLEGFERWDVEFEPFVDETPPDRRPAFRRAILRYEEGARRETFELLAPAHAP